MIAVITIHTSAAVVTAGNYQSAEWMIHNIFDGMSRWAVPVFVMISGSQFLDNNKDLKYKKIFTKYIPRIIFVFFVWSVLYCLIFNIFLAKEPAEVSEIIKAIVKGHYHMWYLHMLIGLYLTIPVLRLITSNMRVTEYFLLLAFTFAFFVPSFAEIVQLIDGRLYALTNLILKNLQLYLPMGYTAYFVLGDYLNKKQISKQHENLIYVFGASGMILTSLLTYVSSVRYGFAYINFYENHMLWVLAESSAVFVFFKNHSSEKLNSETQNIIQTLSQYSFGVYLIHVLVLTLIKTYLFNTLSFTPILSIPVMIILTLVLSIGITAVLKKIPVLGKYLL